MRKGWEELENGTKKIIISPTHALRPAHIHMLETLHIPAIFLQGILTAFVYFFFSIYFFWIRGHLSSCISNPSPDIFIPGFLPQYYKKYLFDEASHIVFSTCPLTNIQMYKQHSELNLAPPPFFFVTVDSFFYVILILCVCVCLWEKSWYIFGLFQHYLCWENVYQNIKINT